MPRVSVIIPNYNHSKFLQMRLESVFSQTYQDFEVIFLDDASTDDSRAVFERISEPYKDRITAVYNETNSGSPFKQWNKGARLAKGEYLWIAESDDYADPTFLAELVRVLNDNPVVGIAYCHSRLADELGNHHDWSEAKRADQDFIGSGKKECTEFLVHSNSIPNASAALVRKSVLEQVGSADETMLFCGDWMTWAKMLLVSDVGFIAQPLSYFRIHKGSVSSRLDRTLLQVHERYRIVQYIDHNLDVPHKRLAQACESIMSVWLRLYLTNPSLATSRQSVRVYRKASAVDPRFYTRLIKHLFAPGFRRLGLDRISLALKNMVSQ